MDTSATKNSIYLTCSCGVEVSYEGRSRPTVRGHTPPEATGGAPRILSRPPRGGAVGLPEDAVHEHPLHLLPGPAIAIVHRAIPQLERVEPDRFEEMPRRVDREESRDGPLPPDEDWIFADGIIIANNVGIGVVVGGAAGAIARRGWLESKHGHVVDLDEIPREIETERES